MVDLPMPGEDLGFGDLANDESIIECGGTVVERPGGPDDVGRGGIGDVPDSKVIESLPVARLVRFEPGQFAERGHCLFVIVFVYCGLCESIQRGNQVVIFSYSQEDLCKPSQSTNVILVLVQYFPEEVDRLVFLSF